MALNIEDAGPVVQPDTMANSPLPTTSAPEKAAAVDRVAEAKAKAKENVRGKGNVYEGGETPKPAETPPAATAEIKGDPELLQQVTRLSAERRKLRERLEALEADGTIDKAKRLDAVEAETDPIKKLEALKIDAEALQLAILNRPDDGTTDAKLAEVNKSLADIAAKLDASEKAREAEKAQATEAEKAAAQEAAAAESTTHVSGILKADPKRWPLASTRKSAAADATKIAIQAVKTLGRAVTDEEAQSLFESALDEVEAYHRDDSLDVGTGNANVNTQQQQTRETAKPRPRPTTIDGSSRAVTQSAPERKHVTAAEAKRIALENIRAKRA